MRDKILKILSGYSKIDPIWHNELADEILEVIAEQQYRDSWVGVNWAEIDPVKWGNVVPGDKHDWLVAKTCPEELKRAYAAIREVREALLELEKKL